MREIKLLLANGKQWSSFEKKSISTEYYKIFQYAYTFTQNLTVYDAQKKFL